jgi:hydrogenase maturation protease
MVYDVYNGQGTRILVLGVGNVLLCDEGIGVHAVESLRARYRFSSNVELLEGGTQGLMLLGSVLKTDSLIVVDAIKHGGEPGTVYRLELEEARNISSLKNSLHEFDILTTLSCVELLGNLPPTVFIGMEPEDITSWGTELTETASSRLEDLVSEVLKEIEKEGGTWRNLKAVMACR